MKHTTNNHQKALAIPGMPKNNFRQFAECQDSQAIPGMPRQFPNCPAGWAVRGLPRHSGDCLNPRFACNIYTYSVALHKFICGEC